MIQFRNVFFLYALLFVSGCSSGVLGSCTTVEADGQVSSCLEFSGNGSKSGLKNACENSTNSIWSGDPCDSTKSCGYCDANVPGGTDSKQYFYDAPGFTQSEATYEALCITSERHSWVDNADITCG